MGSTGTTNVGGSAPTAQSVEIPGEYRLSTGQDSRSYFEYGGYTASYTPEQFTRDFRTVNLYGGIDFERSGYAYEPQRIEYEEARKRWRKQIQYNSTARRDGLQLTTMSVNKLKTLYKQSSSEEVRRYIAAEMNVRGFYLNNDNWRSRGGGR